MLPIRIELRNFLAYRSVPSLSFEGIHLACLSGSNGAGKSSLLDAMTWALWGHARARSDDELIHMGQEEMCVIFEFEQDDVRYRVRRERSKKGRGLLALARWDPLANDFCTVSGESMRETQDHITRVLRLDYETFVHSAFIQQGKADAFTTAKPAQRKETLAKILRLSDWEDYEDSVKAKLQQITNDLKVVEALMLDYEQKEVSEPELLQQQETASWEVEEARKAREAADQRLAEVAGAAEALISARAQFENTNRRIKSHQAALAKIEIDLKRQQQRYEEYQAILDARDTIEENYQRLELARQIRDEQGEKLEQLNEAEKQLNGLVNQLNDSRSALENKITLYAERVAKAEQIAAQGQTVAADLAQIESALQAIEEQEAVRDNLQTQITTLNEEAAALRTRNDALTTEMDAIKERLDLIESSAEALCPVCRQPLTDEHRATLAEQYRSEGTTRGDTFRANKRRLKDIEAEVADHKTHIAKITADARQRDSLNKQAGKLRQQAEQGQQAAQSLAEDRTSLETMQQALANEDFGHDIRAEINALQVGIEQLGYDKEAYSEAKQALNQLRDYEKHKQELENAERNMPDVEANIQSLQLQYEGRTHDLEQESADAENWQKEIEVLKVREQELRIRQPEVNRLRIAERQAIDRLNDVRNALAAIYNARQRKLELQAQRTALREDEATYQQLREAFSKNGIPAMIIEAAIPELENATNRLLTRMTDGRMHVRFDTQRENKSGSVSETFEIKISDELGERDYDMFSGGEGFRINFALRIALSQFLARRAGARLQTLVIDEGFGSQDTVGRERLVEAINAISQDFDLILIVTHIDELRDQFPVHIQVNKSPSGSSIAIQ